jgi:ribose 1,5-bisphosphokinase PhnN
VRNIMGDILAFVGPAGAGKTSIVKYLQKPYGQGPHTWYFGRLIGSTTSRDPKHSDSIGEYEYVEDSVFTNEEESFAWITTAHGNHYGTRSRQLEYAKKAPGKHCIVVVPYISQTLTDWHTAYRKENPEDEGKLHLYCISASPKILRERLEHRGDQDIERRINDCATWVENAQESGLPYHYIENNDTIADACEKIIKKIS